MKSKSKRAGVFMMSLTGQLVLEIARISFTQTGVPFNEIWHHSFSQLNMADEVVNAWIVSWQTSIILS